MESLLSILVPLPLDCFLVVQKSFSQPLATTQLPMDHRNCIVPF